MLGALEVKAITRLANEHAAEWKPIHTAVIDCLLAHRNRSSGRCFPERRLIAAHCNVSERTVDRTIDQLVGWGAIERQQPRALSSQQFRETQYSFRFELPQSVDNGCEIERKSCADRPPKQGSRATNSGAAVRQNAAGPCDKITGAVRQNRGPNKEEVKDLEVKDQIQVQRGEAPPTRDPLDGARTDRCRECGKDGPTPGCKTCEELTRWVKEKGLDQELHPLQWFDERDLRKWAEAWKEIGRRNAEGVTRCSGMTMREIFEAACSLAGVTIARGLELDELRKKWPAPDKLPDWLKETG